MTKALTSRIGWIDTAKGIGLLCVILGHLSIPYLDMWIYFFHMPLFFFLSGFAVHQLIQLHLRQLCHIGLAEQLAGAFNV